MRDDDPVMRFYGFIASSLCLFCAIGGSVLLGARYLARYSR